MIDFKPVIFNVGGQKYGVDIGIVQGIENILPIVQIPNSNPNIKGMINLRGMIIPIYSLRRKFRMPELADTSETKFIIVQTGTMMLGLEVDKVDEMQNVSNGSIHEVPLIVKTRDTGYADKIISANNQLIVIIAVEHLLTDLEMEELAEIMQNME